jgi:biopolymer transport protein ExbD
MQFRKERKRRVTPNVDLTPLIDVVFQLLIFFMLSATFVVQTSIQIEMPKAEGTTKLEQKDLTITIAHGEGGPDNKGRIFVDNVEMASLEELSRVLQAKVTDNPDVIVLVRSDARAVTGRLLEVLGIASSVGVTHFSILALPEDEA